MVGKKRLRSGSGHTVNPTSKTSAPKCKGCKAGMNFDPMRGVWQCPEESCGLVARPKRTNEDAPVIGSGRLTTRSVTIGEDTHVFLVSDDNVCLDITELVEEIAFENDPAPVVLHSSQPKLQAQTVKRTTIVVIEHE